MTEPRVLRISLRDPTQEEKAELRRVFGQPGTVRTLSSLGLTSEQLVETIRKAAPDAIVVTAATKERRDVIDSLRRDFIVLEPIVIERERDHYWQQRRNPEPRPIRVNVGLGTRNERRELERLRDGELLDFRSANRRDDSDEDGRES